MAFNDPNLLVGSLGLFDHLIAVLKLLKCFAWPALHLELPMQCCPPPQSTA